MLTLWDLLKKQVRPPAPPPQAPPPRRRVSVRPKPESPSGSQAAAKPAPAAPSTMQDRYDRVTREMLELHGVRVRRWRTSMSGIAWQVRYHDGRTVRLIEAPRPKGPMSAAVFLHEIGHHAIGFNTYKPRCLEEYHAWAFALDQMDKLGLNITESVRRRMHNSLRYAIQKAHRRGLKQLPPELTPFLTRWPGGAKSRRASAPAWTKRGNAGPVDRPPG